MASIEELLSQLGGMNYSPPSSYKGYQSGYKAVDRSLPNWKPTKFKQSDFTSLADEKKKKKSSGVSLFDVLSGTLGQPSGLVTNAAYNIIDDLMDKDTPLWKKVLNLTPTGIVNNTLKDGMVAGGKQQWKNWTDGDLSWGDVPGVGFLHGMDKGWKRGEDIMTDQAKVDNRWGKVGGGLAIDIVGDPLTYLTGGLSAATKLSKAAELTKTAELAKDLGMTTTKFRKADDFLEAAEQGIKANYIKKFTNDAGQLNVSESLINRAVTKKVNDLADQIKTARNTKFNSSINDYGFAVPFTNKFGKIGSYGSKNLLHRSETTVDAKLVDDLIRQASRGNGTQKTQLENFIKSRYDVGDTSQLSKTMFDDLTKVMNPFINSSIKGLPDVSLVSKMVKKAMPQEDFVRLMDQFKSNNIKWKDVQKQLDEIMAQVGDNPQLRASFGSQLAEMVAKYWENAPVKNFNKVANQRKAEAMSWASKFLKDSDTYKTVENTVDKVFKKGNPDKLKPLQDKEFYRNMGRANKSGYNEMGNFKTKFEHALDKKNIFDARTLATGNKFVNSMGDHIADAHSQRVGETARYSRSMDKIQRFVDKYTGDKDKLMKEAIYTLEKHAPDSLGGKNFVPSADAQKLANLIKPVIDRIGSEEQGAGVLEKLRANYFPHVINKDANLDEIADYMKRAGDLNGQSAKSKFNKERTSFQTLAQRDNYIEKLEKAIQKETDSATIESLERQRDRVADMFDTDVVSALQRRIKEGVRAKSMKALQGNLSKYGMFKTVKQGSKGANIPTGLQELTPDEAKKLGLGEGRHFIQPDVLKGMKRVDEIFTAEGMNKTVRHVSAIADIWRPLVTYYKPSHYVNNIIGNTINNIAAGVGLRDYKAAQKLIAGYRKGELTEAQMKVMEQAYKHNVISGGFLYDAHQTFEFQEPTKLENIAKAVGDNKVVRGMKRYGGDVADDISRLANFLNGYSKYGKVEEAAKQVRTYLFNYNELTNADRGMRVVVPFWNWTKRNVPLQMKLLMENPKFALSMERFKQLFNEHEEGADWQKESGIKVTDDYYASLPSPTHDLDLLLNPKQFLGSMTPVGKVPLELSMNKKLFSGRPISYGEDSVQPEDVPEYLFSNLGIGGNAYDAFSGDRSIGESIVNLFKNVSKINQTGE